MNPRTRSAGALVISLVLWIPVAINIVTGSIDLPLGGIYYLVALGFGWLATGVLNKIISGYRIHADLEIERAKQQILEIERRVAAEDQQLRRRKTDAEDSSSSGEAGHYDDDAPTFDRPRRNLEDE